MVSMYMPTFIDYYSDKCKNYLLHYMGTFVERKSPQNRYSTRLLLLGKTKLRFNPRSS
jgi:hypothetical protein